MALVEKFEKNSLGTNSKHSKADCTYSIVTDEDGNKLLQLDTYGSNQRQFKGKKSQSIRLSTAAIEQLKSIIDSELK